MSGDFKDVTKRADLKYLNKKDRRMRFNTAEPLPYLFNKVEDRPMSTLLKEFFNDITKEVVAAFGVDLSARAAKKAAEAKKAETLAKQQELIKQKQELLEKLKVQQEQLAQKKAKELEAQQNNQQKPEAQ